MRSRQKAAKPLRPMFLVLCKGSQTEPNYFDAFARFYGLTNLVIPRDNVTDPLGLVKLAIKALKAGNKYTMAYVVVDRDSHPSFQAAQETARQFNFIDNRLRFIVSYPCFEIWLLLHKTYTRAYYSSSEALKTLIDLIPDYEKSSIVVMDDFVLYYKSNAIPNANRSINDAELTDELNSSTNVHKMLIEICHLSF